MVKLTSNEQTILRAMLTYNNPEIQKSDNPSNVGIEEVMEILDWTKPQAAALIGSLLTKKMVRANHSIDVPFHVIFLTDLGIDTIFSYNN